MKTPTRETPFRIVITGGPCAGKTELWHFLGSMLHRAVLVPEVATELILAGKTEERLGLEDFQRAVFQRQWESEEEALKRGPFLICDRGLLDGMAYFPGLLACLDLSAEEVLNRYAMVLHLAVIQDPRLYAVHSQANPARKEEHARAMDLDKKIRRIYERHPMYVSLRGSLEKKRREALFKLRRTLADLRPDLAADGKDQA